MPGPPPPPPPPPPPASTPLRRVAPPPPPPPPGAKPSGGGGPKRAAPPPPPPPSRPIASPPALKPIIKPNAKRPSPPKGGAPAPPPPPPPPPKPAGTGPRPPPPPPPTALGTRAPPPPPPPPAAPPSENSVGGVFLPPAPDFPETLRFSEHGAAAKFPSFTMDLDDGDNTPPPAAQAPLDDLQDITNHARVNRNSTYVRNTNTNGSHGHGHDDVGTTLNTQTSTTLDTDSSGLGGLGLNMNMGGLGLPPGLDPIHHHHQQQHGGAGNPNAEDVKPWDKPMDFDTMASLPPIGGASGSSGDDDEDDAHVGFDVPDRLTIGPGAAAARLDLHRCTIRVHKQLVDQIKTHSMKSPTAASGKGKDGKNGRTKNNKGSDDEDMSRCQGELWLKSRVPMRGWKKRYGSIVDHAYFGPVLFLFKYDAKGNVTLTNSMMIVLVDSHVRLGKNTTTKDREYRCEFVLKTTKRRYTIAANHTMRRDYWLRNLESIQQQASTNSFS